MKNDYDNIERQTLSKNKIKYIASLKQKKHRENNTCFVAEGRKLVCDLIDSSLRVLSLVATQEELSKFEPTKLSKIKEIYTASSNDLERISSLKNSQSVLAVIEIPKSDFSVKNIEHELSIFLDDVRDPGNLGTIIRIADWFGIKNIFCSKNSVDVFNPKVVQATMGAIARIRVNYVDNNLFFKELEKLDNFPVYGTFLEGKNIYNEKLSSNGLIVMGNEGKGISQEVENFITNKLYIPPFPENEVTSESLNVSMATSIVCSEFRRRIFV